MQYAKIRKHRKRLKVARWFDNHLKGFVAAWQWIKRKWQPIGSRLSWIKKLNPFRYIKILDRYIIRKFIGTYLFAIALIISISIVVVFLNIIILIHLTNYASHGYKQWSH